MPSVYAPIYKSLIRSTSDFINTSNAAGVLPTMAYQDWESRGDETKLPQTTLLGIDGFSFKENGGLWLISYALALSSYRDANLLHEIDIVDAIQQEFGEKEKIALLDATGAEFSQLIVTDFSVLPMMQSQVRNYRTIGIEVKRTENF